MFQKRTVLLVAVLTALFTAVALLAVLISRTPSGFPPLPTPNGYDDLLKAGDALQGDVPGFGKLDDAGLRTLIFTNAEALRLLRLGLSRRCALNAEAAVANYPAMHASFLKLRSLALLLVAEGRLAGLEHRPGAAARSYVAAIRLGNEISRGGFSLNRIVGIACEADGGRPLVKLLPKLEGEEARIVVADLAQIETERVTWAEIRKTDRIYNSRQKLKLGNPITQAEHWWEERSMSQDNERIHNGAVARVRLLAIELALRGFQAERGRAPERLEQLAPQWLPRVPLDPFTGKSLVYRPQGTNWLLYSVGRDRVDDGGKSVARSTSLSGDILLNSPW